MQVEQQPGERCEGLLRRFGRTIITSGLLGEAKRKRHYLSQGGARRAKIKSAERKRRRKAARDAARERGPPVAPVVAGWFVRTPQR